MQRLLALAGKELIQIRRDRRTLAMMIVLPLLWIVMFGYAFNFDVQEMRVIILDQSGTEPGALVAEALARFDAFALADVAEHTEAGVRDALYRDQVRMGILIPPGFGEGAPDQAAPLHLLIDGADLFGAQSAAQLVQRALAPIQGELQRMVQSRLMAERPPGMPAMAPVSPLPLTPSVEILYNPDLKTANVMIPGLLGLVTMFMTTMLTAMGLVREREHGTLEQLVVTPIRPLELIVGKLLPYAGIAVLQFGMVFAAGLYLFDLTFAGDLPLFLGLATLFLLTTLGLGLLLSTLAQNQQQAMQLALFVIVPQILLSGLIFPLSSMPKIITYIAQVLPLTHFVPIARGMFLKGQDLSLLGTQALVLAGYAVAVVALATVRFRKRLT